MLYLYYSCGKVLANKIRYFRCYGVRVLDGCAINGDARFDKVVHVEVCGTNLGCNQLLQSDGIVKLLFNLM